MADPRPQPPNISLQRTSSRRLAAAELVSFAACRSSCVGAVLVLLAALAAAAQPVRALSESDFRVNGVSDRASKVAVLGAFGPPERVGTVPNDFDPDAPITRLEYEGLEIDYITPENILGFDLTTPRWETARGLRVGDTVERVRQLYGAPAPENIDSSSWEYHDPKDKEGLHVISFEVSDGHVKRIFVGWTLD